MSTTPANLPASRADRLSSQVAPLAATFSEIAFTSSGLSSPTKVRTSGVVMSGLLGGEATVPLPRDTGKENPSLKGGKSKLSPSTNWGRRQYPGAARAAEAAHGRC